jgi:hypothetical protein
MLTKNPPGLRWKIEVLPYRIFHTPLPKSKLRKMIVSMSMESILRLTADELRNRNRRELAMITKMASRIIEEGDEKQQMELFKILVPTSNDVDLLLPLDDDD